MRQVGPSDGPAHRAGARKSLHWDSWAGGPSEGGRSPGIKALRGSRPLSPSRCARTTPERRRFRVSWWKVTRPRGVESGFERGRRARSPAPCGFRFKGHATRVVATLVGSGARVPLLLFTQRSPGRNVLRGLLKRRYQAPHRSSVSLWTSHLCFGGGSQHPRSCSQRDKGNGTCLCGLVPFSCHCLEGMGRVLAPGPAGPDG